MTVLGNGDILAGPDIFKRQPDFKVEDRTGSGSGVRGQSQGVLWDGQVTH